MFLGINIFWALLRAHFNPRLTARAKMSECESGPKHIYAREHKLYCFSNAAAHSVDSDIFYAMIHLPARFQELH